MKNLEIKARCGNWKMIQAALRRLGARRAGTLRQVDTYFHVPSGRLKLREFSRTRAELIFYRRAENTSRRWSHYEIYDAPRPAILRQMLAAALGVKAVVQKRRVLYLHRNARVHLDEVKGLGKFLEIEIVEPPTAAQGRVLLQELLREFALPERDFLRESYSDLILARK
ncbi:MAG TPA: class IV adenylate cyclase [Verrucomicrobiae bacterium]|jgi:predicted adenylyl cyclase CyaB|nr:class IV adenylate cyclase [Verrucomicrobiae bacterium]